MQQKLQCTDEKWLPEEGIQLWKVNSRDLVQILTRVPKVVMPRPMKGHDDIVKGLNGYIQYQENRKAKRYHNSLQILVCPLFWVLVLRSVHSFEFGDGGFRHTIHGILASNTTLVGSSRNASIRQHQWRRFQDKSIIQDPKVNARGICTMLNETTMQDILCQFDLPKIILHLFELGKYCPTWYS